mgnify:CR=1 FL=1
METRCLRLVVLLFCLLTLVAACAGQRALAPAPQPGEDVLTQEEIITLSRQGAAPEEIIARIERSREVFVLRAADVARLQAAGVDNQVIDHMMGTYVRALTQGPGGVRSSLWYRQGHFYAAPPFSAYQGAYRFPE